MKLKPDHGEANGVPSMLRVEMHGDIVHLCLHRPAKRNAINDDLIAHLHTAFVNLPREARVAVVSGEGEHFCAGLDLADLSGRGMAEGVQHSRAWHAAFDAVQFGRVPVIAVLRGAVVGGGLELASSAHLRVAETSAFYGLPEGQLFSKSAPARWANNEASWLVRCTIRYDFCLYRRRSGCRAIDREPSLNTIA